jgi:3',5'-cyclic AMP phosphodiesterase CpdA
LRLAHFSDVHFTEAPFRIPWQHLVSKRILGWVNLTVFRRYPVFAGTREVAEALVRDLAEVRPDHIISTGDLTGISLPSEFAAARAAFAPLLARNGISGIPGNHDVYVRSAVRQDLYGGSFGAWTRTVLTREEFPAELRASYPYPLLEFLGDDVALISLHDVRPTWLHDSSGRVGKTQTRMLERVLADERLSGKTRVLALHTGLSRGDGSPDRFLHGLRDAARVQEAAARGGVALVIHGHIHRRFVIPAGARFPYAVANPGSVTSSRHERAYHLYDLAPGGRIEVRARRYDPARKAFADWPEAPGTGVIRG